MRRICQRKFSVRLISTELIPTRLIFTKEAYRAAPFSLRGTTFVLFNYIVPKYLKPTIYRYVVCAVYGFVLWPCAVVANACIIGVSSTKRERE